MESYVWGSELNDYLIGATENNVIYGYGGNDVLRGGSGNDTLIGGDGADTYVFSGSWGQDIIVDSGSESHIFFRDVTLSQLEFEQVGMNLLIKKIGTNDQITISNQFRWLDENFQDFLLTDFAISNWEFADGLVLNSQQMHGLLENPYHDNTKSRIINENNQAEIHGTKASEMIFGNAGNDVIISGGGKSDTLVGGAGADTYVFSTVFSPNGKEVESAKIIDGQANNHVYFNQALLSDVVFLRGNLNGEDLHVLATNGVDSPQSVTVVGQYASKDDWDGKSVVNWEFADGQTIQSSHIKLLVPQGWHNDETRIVGSNIDEDINGSEKHETLFGQYGNDVLNGGLGDDILVGGAGADTYVLNGDWGQDHIIDFNADNHMYFRDVNLQDVAFIRDGEDLIIQKLDSANQVTVLSQFKNDEDFDAQVIINWEFANGQILKAQDVNAVTQLASAMAGMGSDTHVTIGSATNNLTQIQLAVA